MKVSMVLSRLMKMRHVILYVAILIGIASLAFGGMYKWVDEKGTVHFTDDYYKIPERYRTEVESRVLPKEPSPSPAKAKPIPAAVSKAPEPKASEVKLIGRHGVWLADVALNKRVKRQFVVDTGASFTLINRKTANELGIVIDEDTLFLPMGTVSGFTYSPLVILKSLRVGEAVVEDVEAIVHTMPSEHDGLLGNSFFNKFSSVVLNAANKKMTLFSLKRSPSPDRPGGYGKDYWTDRFRFFHKELAKLKQIKKGVGSRSGSSEVNRINKAIRFYEKKLAELERKASLAGVPKNWRW